MTQFTDRGLTEIASGLAQAQAVLRRRRENLQRSLAAIESEVRELTTIESAVGMAIEILKATAAAREQAASST